MSKNNKSASAGRGKNWQDEECKLLAQRWDSVSEDPEKGKDQPREEFWSEIAESIDGRTPDSWIK